MNGLSQCAEPGVGLSGRRATRKVVSSAPGAPAAHSHRAVDDLREREAIGTGGAKCFPPGDGEASDHLMGEGGERLRSAHRGSGPRCLS